MKFYAIASRFVNSFPVGAISAVIFSIVLLLTLMPSDDIPSVSIPHIDKVVHFVMFGALSVVFLFDCSRYVGRVSYGRLIAVAMFSSLSGGVIELLQGMMGMGRGADWFDFLADSLGAFLMPLALYPVIRYLVFNYSLEFRDIRKATKLQEGIVRLYTDSFPEDERRPLGGVKNLIDAHGAFHFSIVRSRNRVVGFISWWRLDSCFYVEHFAVKEDLRSKGYGKAVLERFCSLHGRKGIVLEVELPGTDDLADRRIRFYERCGFKAHREFDYVQPPYAHGLQPVPLLLMTYGHIEDINRIVREIHREVYNNPASK